MEMMLSKKSLSDWIKKLDSYKIYLPVQSGDTTTYEEINGVRDLSLDFGMAVQSPKKYIFPQREVLLEFEDSGTGHPNIIEVLPEDEQVVIFGVRPCEAKAVILMDKVFSGEHSDPYYWKRRKQTVMVGMSCNEPPSENCFCTSVDGSPYSTEGLDILLTDTGGSFFVNVISDNGKEILNKAKNLFKDADPSGKKKTGEIHLESEKKIKRQVEDIKSIPPKLKQMFDATIWDTDSQACIRCGICTYLCPTCHCFDISDEIETVTPLKGKRVRTWDTCQFPDFTMHSSGHNPRPDKASRLRQRIMHKFNYFVQNNDNYQCTGCGRCISKCPVSIDLIGILDKAAKYE